MITRDKWISNVVKPAARDEGRAEERERILALVDEMEKKVTDLSNPLHIGFWSALEELKARITAPAGAETERVEATQADCSECGGNGRIHFLATIGDQGGGYATTCPRCDGFGSTGGGVTYDGVEMDDEMCGFCSGYGRVPDGPDTNWGTSKCDRCNGTGKLTAPAGAQTTEE